MKQITLKLFPNFNRPVVKLVNFHSFFAMIDTGAVYPVWMSGEERLERLGAKKIQNVIEFGGLGGMTKGGLYEIPAFQLGDLIYPNMKIIAHKSSFPVPLLLPATMFNNLIYEINNKTHCLNITVPDDESPIRNLTIKEENGRLHVFCSSAKQ